MPKSYGFTAIEIVFVIIVIAALGFAGWTWWQTQQNQERVTESSDTSQQHQGQGRNKTEQPSDSTDGWHQYQNSELGYTFRYPPEWSVDDDLNKLRSGSSHRYTGDKYAGVVLRSDVYREENKGIGGPYTVKGAKIRLLKSREFTGMI